MSNTLKERLRAAILKTKLFLFKISHELSRAQAARLLVSNTFQRRILIRVLRYIAIGEIPILKTDYAYLKSKRRQSILCRLADRDFFLNLLKADSSEQIEYLKKLLCVLRQLLRPLFYRDIANNN